MILKELATESVLACSVYKDRELGLRIQLTIELYLAFTSTWVQFPATIKRGTILVFGERRMARIPLSRLQALFPVLGLSVCTG